MWHGKNIAVVVPAYDEARLIGRTLAAIPDYVDQVHVVDDCSTDGTLERVRTAGGRVRCHHHDVNRGVGAAIVTGYRAALAEDADVLVVMAGDAQMDASDLPQLLDALILSGADYAKGNRFLHWERRRMPFTRRLAGKVLSAATRWATAFDIDDSQCGFTALSARCATRLPLDDLWPRYGYPNDLLAMLADARARVVEVPVRPLYGDEKSGVRPWHVLTISYLLARRHFRTRPYFSFDHSRAARAAAGGRP